MGSQWWTERGGAKVIGKRLFAFFLALCLLAGCKGAENPSIPESSLPPPEPPASSSLAEPEPILSQVAGRPALEPPPVGSVLPQEDPEKPGWLAGGRMYYQGDNRLTLYAMEPETGAIRTVREQDFWNGREVEDISPSGNRVLLSSWDGAPGPEVMALSLYNIEEDCLVNLSRTMEEPYRAWTESHWFPWYGADYCFVDENTFCHARPCFEGTQGKGHFHFYDIEEDGTVTARFWLPECPEPDEKSLDWRLDCRVLREERTILCRFPTAERGWEWLTWDIGTGKLLSRTPAENGGRNGRLVNGVMYYIDEDPEHEVFRLIAYDINTDTEKALVTGPMIRAGDEKNWDWSGRGAFENILLRVRDDGSFEMMASKTCFYTEEGWSWDSDKEHRYYKAIWDPSKGGEIAFEEKVAERTVVKSDSGRDTGLSISIRPSEDQLITRILPDRMQEEDSFQGPPHILSMLSSGEILFLAH
jgi:hypothetical protein